MAPRSKRKDQEPAAAQGDAYEPPAVGAADMGEPFPPVEQPIDGSSLDARIGPLAQRVASNTRIPPDQGQGKKEWVKSLTVITDPDAGMRFHFDYEYHKGVITFEEEPSATVKRMLHDGGYRWKGEVKAWLLPLTTGHWEADRKHAKKVFWQVADAVRSEKGLPPRAQSQDQGPIPD